MRLDEGWGETRSTARSIKGTKWKEGNRGVTAEEHAKQLFWKGIIEVLVGVQAD